MTNLSKEKNLPLHVGIIMDGNRRWAKNHSLPVASGHSRGAEVFENTVKYCNKIGLKYLTVFAFSTENWKRSENEIKSLMFLFKKYLKRVMEKFKNENMQINFIGDIAKFSSDIKKMILTIEEETHGRDGLTLKIAMNYGSRMEIVNSAKILATQVLTKKISVSDINENLFAKNLYTENQPDVDLIIRTANEKRISNFLLWQAAYSEFYFTDVLWPDFSESEFDKAINDYFRRTRRFGGK